MLIIELRLGSRFYYPIKSGVNGILGLHPLLLIIDELTLFIDSDWLTDELCKADDGGLIDLPPLRLCFLEI